MPFIDKAKIRDIHQTLLIPKEKTIYLHFGALEERKGTLDILKAILISEKKELENKAFVFAGLVGTSIKEQFYNLVGEGMAKTTIKIYDEFCDNDFLYNLCYTCDCILIPYKNTIQSSGVLGYASYFQKPVIGPNKNLLGRLISDNKLGIIIEDVSPEGLKDALMKDLPLCSSQYASNHKIKDFNNIIYNQLL